MSRSNFCRSSLKDLRDRAESFRDEYPPLHNLLVLPPGEMIRIPPAHGVRPLRSLSIEQLPDTVNFGRSTIRGDIPPRCYWPPKVRPACAIAVQGGHGDRLDWPPYRIHLFFGSHAAIKPLMSLASALLDLCTDLTHTLFPKSLRYGPRLMFHDNNWIRGDEARVLDRWLCTVHCWAWKAVDLAMHTQIKVLFGMDAHPVFRTNKSARDQLSFSSLPFDVFSATVATIDLFLRFIDEPPNMSWDADYPNSLSDPEPAFERDSSNALVVRDPIDARTQRQAARTTLVKPKQKWQLAQNKLMKHLRTKSLPKSIRGAAKLLQVSYDTTRRAVHNSAVLMTHFNLKNSRTTNKEGNLLEELANQADRRTKEAIKRMTLEQRKEAENTLQEMQPNDRLDLLRTLAVDPNAGSTGDVSLIENADGDCRGKSDWTE